jgi:glycerol kinase
VPYLISIEEPFLLLSTGTWSISLNPFDNTPLTFDELKKDCLFFLNYEGKPVKASRFLLGLEHEQRTKKLTEYFGLPYDTYKSVNFEYKIIQKFKNNKVDSKGIKHDVLKQNLDEDTQIENYGSFEEAYHHLIYKLVCKQINSTKLVMNGIAVKKIFITGGFSNNSIFMNLLADEFSNIEIFAANVPHASAIGAAMVINKSWNKKCILTNNIRVKKYAKHSPEV